MQCSHLGLHSHSTPSWSSPDEIVTPRHTRPGTRPAVNDAHSADPRLPRPAPRPPSPTQLRRHHSVIATLGPATRRRSQALDTDVYGRPVRRGARASSTADLDLEVSSSAEPVVKVYSVHCGQHPMMPWAVRQQEESAGSGFSIMHNGSMCILTNAHVVADATYVEVRKAGDARKYVATRQKLAHECDLATLHVDDARFWEGVEPLAFGAMPCLQDEVSVVGYPEGGEGVSITQGVVSRIEIQRYAHSGVSLLAIQIDAAINPGNSGGPALDEDGAVIGVAFQNQQDSQNIGYVIPVPTIAHFLADVEASDPTEVPRLPARSASSGRPWRTASSAKCCTWATSGAACSSAACCPSPPPPTTSAATTCCSRSTASRSPTTARSPSASRRAPLSFQHLIHT